MKALEKFFGEKASQVVEALMPRSERSFFTTQTTARLSLTTPKGETANQMVVIVFDRRQEAFDSLYICSYEGYTIAGGTFWGAKRLKLNMREYIAVALLRSLLFPLKCTVFYKKRNRRRLPRRLLPDSDQHQGGVQASTPSAVEHTS